jgi:hypothetical protein
MNAIVKPSSLKLRASASPPALGTAHPGDLYADLQSRTLWLGVDPAVDPAGSVLISDIVSLLADIDDAVVQANAYTDVQIETRAPTVHTHTASQITDFNSAVTDITSALPQLNFTRGMIMMYSGSIADVGVGNLAGWHLCDGGSGTPDLRDKFIIGAGNKAVGAKSSGAAITTDTKGAHVHTVNGTVLSISQIPAHAHASGTLAGTISGTAAAAGAHAHGAANGLSFLTQGSGPGGQGTSGSGWVLTSSTSTAAAHAHSVSGSCDISSGATSNQGGGGSHAHTLVTAGDHAHTIAALTLREAIPYYALAFIMKL